MTFVLTDIESSTKLFARLGELYPPMLEDHNVLLRQVWHAHHGVEVKTVGDSFIVAFASAVDALTAAVAAQRAIARHPWPTDGGLRIRIGVHSGIAVARDGDYIALALHQAARVVSAANGGQVVASDDAIAAIDGDLSVRIEPIGAFRLRDFDHPVRLSAVTAEGERPDLTALRAVPADGHNLVRPLTAFVGRADEVEGVRARVVPRRLVTIVGAGGMGKTRLAVEVGFEVADCWPDGVWMVDLSSVSDPQLVAVAIADAIGVSGGDEADESAVLSHLERRAALIVLDNCEHVLETTSRIAATLLRRCQQIAILATSRVPLSCPGEQVWRIQPLNVRDECVDLFYDRARSHLIDGLGNDLRETVVQICDELDGMPLAIELAAARLSVLSPAEILAGLRDRFRLLRTSDPTAAPRQRSMQALLDWGHELLSEPERIAFARLSLFQSSFDLDGAAAVVGGDPIAVDDVAELVWSLADKSLVGVDRGAGDTRYRMLQTIRAYAGEKLETMGGASDVRARLARYYVERVPWELSTSRSAVSERSLEIDSIVGLIDPLFDDGRFDDALALTRLLAISRHIDGRLTLGLDELQRAINRVPAPTGMLARAHLGATLIAAGLGRVEVAELHLDHATRLVEQFGAEDRWGRLSLARAEADIALRRDDHVALHRVEERLRAELLEPLSPAERADTLFSLGEVLGQLGRHDTRDVLEEVVTIARSRGDEGILCTSLSSLAEHDLRSGDIAAAAAHQRESMLLAADLGSRILVGCALILAARIAAQRRDDAAAARLHAAADPILDDAGFALLPSDQALSDAMRSEVRRRLGPDEYDHLVQEGRRSSLHQAIEAAELVFGLATTG